MGQELGFGGMEKCSIPEVDSTQGSPDQVDETIGSLIGPKLERREPFGIKVKVGPFVFPLGDCMLSPFLFLLFSV